MNTQSHNLLLNPAERVAHYVVQQSGERHGAQWLGSRSPEFLRADSETDLQWLAAEGVILTPRLRERLSGVGDWGALIRNFQLKGVREDSRQGLLGWLEGRYPLHLTTQAPTPEELLSMQCKGERVVSLLTHIQGPIGRHAGAYEFLLHDLEHAHKFFGQKSFSGQQRFFNLLRAALEAGLFEDLNRDSKFRVELEYLMADMNSHPLHLLKYLKAIVLEALPQRSVSELDRWCDELFGVWRLPPPVSTAAHRINYPALENNEDRLRVSDFFAYT